MAERPDAVVIGAGPNGLAAAITIARAGRSVVVYEARDAVGGGARSAELTLPGFVHDICSAIHPLAVASPFMRTIPLENHGVELEHAEAPFAHPLDDGDAVVVRRSVPETAAALGRDGAAYRRLMAPFVKNAQGLVDDFLGPIRIPRHPIAFARFGLRSIRSAQGLAQAVFEEPRARAALAGVAAHSMLRLDRSPTAGFALLLTILAHAFGWPTIKGGSQRLADALASYLRSLDGEIVVGHTVTSIGELPPARAYLFDLTPRQMLAIAGDRLRGRYRRSLERFRYGPGVFKIDWALDAPIPWKSSGCESAGTVHLGGTLDEIAAAERAVAESRIPDRPYVLCAQQSVFDATRAPAGKHTAWAYCHVPAGSEVDMTERIENQMERFAPGFRDVVLARATMTATEMQSYNANYIGGDINGGSQHLVQHLARPALRWPPYATPDDSIYICSSSTPPGGGVHGLCGYFGARAALRRALR